MVKKELATMYKFAIGFAWVVIAFWSCSDDPSKIGLGILPTGDLVHVMKATDRNIQSYTDHDVTLRTDETGYNLLGTINDPVFGKTATEFASQYRISSYPKYKKEDHVDSLVYYVAYKEYYGDSTTPQKFKVYELASDLSFDAKYYQDTDLKSLAKTNALASLTYIPRFSKDSLTTNSPSKADPQDTVTHELAFYLDNSLATKLMTADTTILSDNKLFTNYFKGLYVESEDISQGGAVMKIIGSGLVLYFHKDNDTTKYLDNFYSNGNAARVNRFHHDYSTTSFATDLGNSASNDTLIYLQTTGGLHSKITVPNLGSWTKLIPELADTKDTANLIINQAQLIFTVEPTMTDIKVYKTAEQLFLVAIDKAQNLSDSLVRPSDYYLSPAYFGGAYNKTDQTYRFNITRHMQDIIEGKKTNYGFYLETVYKNSMYRRAVLKGAKSKTGIRLEVTYSKIR